MSKISMADILKLNIEDRIRLVEDIWDTIVSIPDSIELTSEQKEEIDRRLEAHHKNPSAVFTWDDIKKDLEKV